MPAASPPDGEHLFGLEQSLFEAHPAGDIIHAHHENVRDSCRERLHIDMVHPVVPIHRESAEGVWSAVFQRQKQSGVVSCEKARGIACRHVQCVLGSDACHGLGYPVPLDDPALHVEAHKGRGHGFEYIMQEVAHVTQGFADGLLFGDVEDDAVEIAHVASAVLHGATIFHHMARLTVCRDDAVRK